MRFWGVRGSIPVPGPRTNRYGGNTSCVQVEVPGADPIIVDAGTGIRRLGKDLALREFGAGRGTAHLLISHTHWDHIQGLPFFSPLYTRGNRLHVYARRRDTHLRAVFASLAKPDPVVRSGDTDFDEALIDLSRTLDRHRRRLEGEPVVRGRVRLTLPDDALDPWLVSLELVDDDADRVVDARPEIAGPQLETTASPIDLGVRRDRALRQQGGIRLRDDRAHLEVARQLVQRRPAVARRKRSASDDGV